MFFRDVIGQNELKKQLANSVDNGRIPHAQLFYGKQGVGQLALALAYARYLCCQNRIDGDSCGVCPSCVKLSKMAHPDLHFVFPIVKPDSKNYTSDDFLPEFREVVQENTYLTFDNWMNKISVGKQGFIYTSESENIVRKLNFKAYEAPYKVMIIWLPEKMQESCANKLLKILEEPYSGTVFLLASENSEQIITTIRSRTQQHYLSPIPQQEISNALQQKFQISMSDADFCARNAMGSFSLAQKMLNDTKRNEFFLEKFISLMRLAWTKDFLNLRMLTESIEKQGKIEVKEFLSYAQKMLRENFILNLNNQKLNYLTKEELNFSVKFSQFINERNILQLMEEFQNAEIEIDQNVNVKIVLFDLSLKICSLLKK